MVPLIERSTYLSDLRKNTKYDHFYSLVYGVSPIGTFSLNAEVDKIFADILAAIRNDNEVLFEQSYAKLSRRIPNRNSPFANDDLLLFILVIGINKFQADNALVQRILDTRESSDMEGKLIKRTFQNIINRNYKSSDNAFQIIVVMEDLLKVHLLSWDEKKEFYQRIISDSFPFNRSDFLNTMSLRAYDLITIDADKSEEGLFPLLKDFNTKFLKRTKVLSHFLLTGFTILFVYSLVKLISWSPDVKNFFDEYDPVLGVLGLGVISNWIAPLKKIFYACLLVLFGYPKVLINKLK